MRGRLLTLVLIIGLIAAACTNGGSGSDTGGSGSSPADDGGGGGGSGGTIDLGGQAANDHGTKSVSGATSLEVELDNFYFSPTTIQGDASQKVTLTLTNDSSTLHNFSVQAFNETIDQDVKPGETKEVEVQFGNVLDSIAVFECKYHASQGMRGALQVPR
ncbi:MAG: cupredoxin domain-containing protein [Actinomycetota bacterium]